MRILLSHSDFAPASLALVNLKGFATTDADIRQRCEWKTVTSHVSESPEAYVDRLIESAREFRPDVVGLSVYIWSRFRMYEATRRLRAELPNAWIVWGGPDVSDAAYAKELLAEHPVDVIVRDEGEQTFLRLLRHRLGIGSSLAEIRGISWRDGADTVETGTVDFLANLDLIPSLLDSDELDFTSVDAIAIETFRGCYMGCNYCYWGGTTRRAFSDKRVFSDLERILALPNVKSLWFFDSMFGYKKSTAKEILRFIVARKRPDMNITFFPNLDFLDDELCALFKEANVYIETGVQTTNDEAYENLNRNWDRAFLDRKLPMLDKWGLRSNSQQLILGIPGDGIEGFRGSVDYVFAKQPESIYIFPFSVLPATGFWRRREEFGLEHDGEFRIVWKSKSFTEEDTLIGGMIMVGAKWYEKFPGLAQTMVKFLGVRPSDFFERIGRTFSQEVWGLDFVPSNYATLRRRLLLQAFPKEDERYLIPEVLRRTLVTRYPEFRHLDAVEELIRAEHLLNCDEVVDGRRLDERELAREVSTWRLSPLAEPAVSVRFPVFEPHLWNPTSGLDRELTLLPVRVERPRDFFKKDRPRYRVLVLHGVDQPVAR